MSLPDSLERAAGDLPELADQIRPANGDPLRVLEALDAKAAARLLAWVLVEAVDDAEELVEVWGEAEKGIEVLLSADDTGLDKAGRKLLRRARHRLRSQGIEVAAQKPPAAREARRALPAVDRWQAAHVSTADFRGTRMGYLAEPHPNGGARLFEMRFDEGRGILDFKIYNAGRSKVRGFLRSLTAGSSERLFEVDRDALRALVWRASRAQPADRPLPTGFVEWRGRLFPDELEKQATPGDLARAALAEADPAATPAATPEEALATTEHEIRAGQLGPWPPPTSWVAERMELGRESLRGLADAARDQAIGSWTDETCEALSAQTDRALLARHLDESAWTRWQSGDEDGARRLLTVATTCVADASAKSDVAARSSLDRARVESLFEPFLAELRAGESSN